MAEWDAKRRTAYRAIVGAVWTVEVAIAAYFSLLPAAKLGDVPGSDKLWHWGGYTLLAVPVCFLFRERRRIVLAVLGLIAFGIALEFAQEFVPGRNFEAADMVFNSIGVVAGVAISHQLAAFSRGSRSLEILAKSGD